MDTTVVRFDRETQREINQIRRSLERIADGLYEEPEADEKIDEALNNLMDAAAALEDAGDSHTANQIMASVEKIDNYT